MSDTLLIDRVVARIRGFVKTQYLPLMLCFGFLFGVLVPTPGKVLGEWHTSSLCIAVIFFISGLALRTDDVKQVYQHKLTWAIACVMILFITPMLAFVALEIPFSPHELSTGLALFSVVPTTLSTCVVFTRQADGNWPLALAITVSTNLFGIFTVPFILQFVFEATGEVSLDPFELLFNLSVMILLPLVCGRTAQMIKKVSDFQVKYKTHLSVVSGFALSLVPWMQVSKSVDELGSISFVQIIYIIIASTFLHFGFIGLCLLLTKFYKVTLPVQIALIFTIGQKTLPVSLTILDFFPESMGEAGIIALPCIIGHLTQTLIDSFLTGYYAEKSKQKVRPCPFIFNITTSKSPYWNTERKAHL
eukprot:TRINITY_DN10664_c0_g1_i1.p1 TRINITY_DN10664_c0_g1~~TRINITY_DN10664_c0_g1_i1.p1  ORF type:complete len:361 (+),score=61.16 TRINITY_DN10664_c0_g1_i1:50-1132(+)